MPFADDAAFREQFDKVKHANKERLARFVKSHQGAIIDPSTVFDTQAKRLHEYKRQLMNALGILMFYNLIVDHPEVQFTPRTYLFGAKASPGYYRAKLIIKLINSIGELVAEASSLTDRGSSRMRTYLFGAMQPLAPRAKLLTNLITAAGHPGRKQTFRDYAMLQPRKFVSITNGITHRRWLMQANPALAKLLDEAIGQAWRREPQRLSDLLPFADDAAFREQFDKVKHANKERLARFVRAHQGAIIDPDTIFDAQAKRLHEYKRQLMNALGILMFYNLIVDHPEVQFTPRTYLFGAKASPGYYRAKLIIKLINSIGELVKKHPRASKLINVVFLENYCVSLAELLMPATEVSEQISTAGKEASGTGNMKFMMNGAVTVGTTTRPTPPSAAPWISSSTASSARRTISCSRNSTMPCSLATTAAWPTLTSCSRICPRSSPRSAAWARLISTATSGLKWRSSTPPRAASSPLTAPSRNTTRKSGIWSLWNCDLSRFPRRALSLSRRRASVG